MTSIDDQRKSLARDLVADLRRLDAALECNAAEIKKAITANGTTLTDIRGIGPVLVTKIIGHARAVARFPTRHHYASSRRSRP